MQGHLHLSNALGCLPGPQGERFVELFKHGTLSVELYAPHRNGIPNIPTLVNEVYVVVGGTPVGFFAEKSKSSSKAVTYCS